MSGCRAKTAPMVAPVDLSTIQPDEEGKMKQIEGVMYQTNAPKGESPDNIYFVQVDPTKCEACGACEEVCVTGAIQAMNEDGIRHVVNPAACMNCGQCLVSCPYGAIYEGVSYVDEIFEKLKDPDTIVVSMPAPAVRYGLGECFGLPTGTYVGGQMHAALKKMGFDLIYDNEWTADVHHHGRRHGIGYQGGQPGQTRCQASAPSSLPAAQAGSSSWRLFILI